MAMFTTLKLVALGALSGSIMITLFNKGITGGARNGAARVAWFLMGTAVGLYVYGAVIGLLYSLDAGVVTARSRGGASVTFHRAEYPLFYWITFLLLGTATGLIVCMSLGCFWKALKRG